jgi:6-bladed beta-propeller
MVSMLSGRVLLILAAFMSNIAIAHGQPEITNSATPISGVSSLHLSEQWRAGGEDDELFFGNVVQVIGDNSGRVFVLDVQMENTYMFSPAGDLLETLGGHGEGPGEVNNINSIWVMDDDQIGQGQVMPGKVVGINYNGDPGESFRVVDPDAPGSSFVLILNGTANSELILLAGMRWSMSETGQLIQDMFLRRYDLDGTPRNSYLTKNSTFDATHFVFDELKFDFIWNRFGLSDSGDICVAPHRNEYLIEIHSPDGELIRTIKREYRSVSRGADDKLQARLTHEGIGSRYGRELQGVTIENTEPDIHSLWTMEEGEIWIRTSQGDRKRPVGVFTTVDIFNESGEFINQRQIMCPGDPLRDGLHLLPDGRVVIVIGAADAGRREVGSTTAESINGTETELEVICYAAQ